MTKSRDAAKATTLCSAPLHGQQSRGGGLAFFSSLPSSWKAKLAAASPRAGPLPWVTGRAASAALARLHLLPQRLPLLSMPSPYPSPLLSLRAANLTVLTVCAKPEGSPEETPCMMESCSPKQFAESTLCPWLYENFSVSL